MLGIWTCRLFECSGRCSSPNGGLVWLNVAGCGEICCWGPWVGQCTLLRVASTFLFVNDRSLVGCVVRLGVFLGCLCPAGRWVLAWISFDRVVSLVLCG